MFSFMVEWSGRLIANTEWPGMGFWQPARKRVAMAAKKKNLIFINAKVGENQIQGNQVLFILQQIV
jgi:hypothetical protein